MRVLRFLPIAAVSAILFISNSANANSVTAEEFVKKASMGNLFEIESSKIANERSQNTDVKQFADRMITDHNTVASELESAVTASNLDSSLITKSLDKKHQEILTKLQKASSKDFDKKFIDEQKDAHKDAIRLFKEYAKNGTNNDLKSFAGKNLPTLEDHHKQLKSLKTSM